MANILKVSRRAIVIKGSKIRRLRSPGEIRVRRVIKRFVKEIVVLTPARTTLKSSMSWAPRPVNFNCEDSGVINVQPDVVAALLEHLVTYVLWRRRLETPSAACQKPLETPLQSSQRLVFKGLNMAAPKPSALHAFLALQRRLEAAPGLAHVREPTPEKGAGQREVAASCGASTRGMVKAVLS
jgi:hypothetical protein